MVLDVPQYFILGPLMFNILVSFIVGTEICNLADDTAPCTKKAFLFDVVIAPSKKGQESALQWLLIILSTFNLLSTSMDILDDELNLGFIK